jgi:hypothetical protein
VPGHTLGREVEADFNRKAEESGLTEEERKNGFNRNMLSTGLLADGPREYSNTFGRKWLVTNYEAGDVVLHNPYAIHASTLNYDPNNVIRVGTDQRFVDSSKPWDEVSGSHWAREKLTNMLSGGVKTTGSAMECSARLDVEERATVKEHKAGHDALQACGGM